MNKAEAMMQLDELGEHIQDVIARMEGGRYDEEGDLSYVIDIAHLMDHLVEAWHYAHLCDDKIRGMAQDDYVKVTCSIPKFQRGYRLVDLYTEVI